MRLKMFILSQCVNVVLRQVLLAVAFVDGNMYLPPQRIHYNYTHILWFAVFDRCFMLAISSISFRVASPLHGRWQQCSIASDETLYGHKDVIYPSLTEMKWNNIMNDSKIGLNTITCVLLYFRWCESLLWITREQFDFLMNIKTAFMHCMTLH